MAATAVLPPMPTSFVYEDLVSKIVTMQNQMMQVNQTIDGRAINDQKVQRQLASRSFVFIDPFGHRMKHRCIDHWTIHKVVQKFKKEYCPKYLHSWVHVGLWKKDEIHPLTEDEMRRTVSDYPSDQEFVAFGDVRIFITNERCQLLQERSSYVLLTDKLEKLETVVRNIRDQIKRRLNVIRRIELRVCQSDPSNQPSDDRWNEGSVCQTGDTIFSVQLYQSNVVVMAKIIEIE